MRLRVLLVIFTLLSPAYLLPADDNTSTAEEVVVTARRTPQRTADTTANISVMSIRDLARIPAYNLNDALITLPGIDIQERSLLGYPSSISIQGANPAHTRLMVDGVLLNNNLNAFANPALIPLGNAERIEVIKGSGSSVWGSALGGVINVITKSPPPAGAKLINGAITLISGGGSVGLWQESLELSGRQGKFGYTFWENQRQTNREFRDNSRFLSQDLATKITYDLNHTTNLFANYQHTRQRIGGYEFDTLGYGDNYALKAAYGAIGVKMTPSKDLNLNVTLKSADQRSSLWSFTVPPPNTLMQAVNSKDVFSGLDINSALRLSERQSISGGMDIGKDRLNSDQISGPESVGRYAGYINHQWRLTPALGLEDGVRYDRNQAYGSQASPAIGAVYHLPRDTNLRLSVSRAFNAPQLIFKFISGNPVVIPNTDLKAERAYTYEFSTESKLMDNLWAKAALYRAEVSDLVNIVEIVPFTTYQAQNVNKTRRQGMEAQAKYTVTPDLSISSGFAYNRVQDRVTGQLIQPGGSSRTTYKLGLEYQHNKTLSAVLQGDYRFWNMPLTSQAQDRKFIWDARLTYRLAKFPPQREGNEGLTTSSLKHITRQPADIFLDIYNLFNRQNYYEVLLPSPGRRIEVGVKYSF